MQSAAMNHHYFEYEETCLLDGFRRIGVEDVCFSSFGVHTHVRGGGSHSRQLCGTVLLSRGHTERIARVRDKNARCSVKFEFQLNSE